MGFDPCISDSFCYDTSMVSGKPGQLQRVPQYMDGVQLVTGDKDSGTALRLLLGRKICILFNLHES